MNRELKAPHRTVQRYPKPNNQVVLSG